MINLESIPAGEHGNVLSCYWIMMRECEEQALNNNDIVLKIQVEGFYKLWNRITGSDCLPRWVKT